MQFCQQMQELRADSGQEIEHQWYKRELGGSTELLHFAVFTADGGVQICKMQFSPPDFGNDARHTQT